MWILLGVTGLLLAAMILTVWRLMEQSDRHVDSVKGIKVRLAKTTLKAEEGESDLLVKKYFAENPYREELRVQHIEMSKGSMKLIGKMKNLTELDMSDCDLKDPWLKYISHLPLRKLSLAGTNASDDGMKYVAKITTLQDLALYDTGVSGKSLPTLEPLTGLHKLDIQGCKVTDEDIAPLKSFTTLTSLNLSGTYLSDKSCDLVSTLDSVAFLDMGKIKMTVPQLAKLKSMKALGDLRLNGCHMTDEHMAMLASFPHLAGLEVAENPITDKGLAMLTPLKLQMLKVSLCKKVSPEAIESFRKANPTCVVIDKAETEVEF